jgi:hypothetical protein
MLLFVNLLLVLPLPTKYVLPVPLDLILLPLLEPVYFTLIEV